MPRARKREPIAAIVGVVASAYLGVWECSIRTTARSPNIFGCSRSHRERHVVHVRAVEIYEKVEFGCAVVFVVPCGIRVGDIDDGYGRSLCVLDGRRVVVFIEGIPQVDDVDFIVVVDDRGIGDHADEEFGRLPKR